MVLNMPEQCDSCDTPFCKRCITTCILQDTNCPACKEVYVSHKFNKIMLKELQEFSFKCPQTGQVFMYVDALEH